MTFEKIYSSTKKPLYITKELRNKLSQILKCLFSFCNILTKKKKRERFPISGVICKMSSISHCLVNVYFSSVMQLMGNK